MTLILFFRRAAFDWGLTEIGVNVSLLALGVALVLVALNANPGWNRAAEFSALRAFRWFGKHSYEVYLSHMFVILPVVGLFKRLESHSIVSLYAFTLLASGSVGALLSRYFSEPLNHWLRTALLARAEFQQSPDAS